jgi:threonine dehydrogenase-like Zn-dependent dehydrogenase
VVGIGTEMNIPLPGAFVKNVGIRMGLGYLGTNKRLIDLVARGKLNPNPIITHRIKPKFPTKITTIWSKIPLLLAYFLYMRYYI